MKILLITFKSRNELYSFSKLLKINSIYHLIISTPSAIGSSCTLSIKTEYYYLKHLFKILQKSKPASILGVYSVFQGLNGNQINKIL